MVNYHSFLSCKDVTIIKKREQSFNEIKNDQAFKNKIKNEIKCSFTPLNLKYDNFIFHFHINFWIA